VWLDRVSAAAMTQPTPQTLQRATVRTWWGRMREGKEHMLEATILNAKIDALQGEVVQLRQEHLGALREADALQRDLQQRKSEHQSMELLQLELKELKAKVRMESLQRQQAWQQPAQQATEGAADSGSEARAQMDLMELKVTALRAELREKVQELEKVKVQAAEGDSARQRCARMEQERDASRAQADLLEMKIAAMRAEQRDKAPDGGGADDGGCLQQRITPSHMSLGHFTLT